MGRKREMLGNQTLSQQWKSSISNDLNTSNTLPLLPQVTDSYESVCVCVCVCVCVRARVCVCACM